MASHLPSRVVVLLFVFVTQVVSFSACFCLDATKWASRCVAVPLQALDSSCLSSDNSDWNDRIAPMIRHMKGFFGFIVDDSTDRLYLYARPLSQERLHAYCPLRELGCTWDATKVLAWQDPDEDGSTEAILRDAVQTTLRYYGQSFMPLAGGGVSLDSAILGQQATLAHTALFVLAAVGASSVRYTKNEFEDFPWNDLVIGMLSCQRPDGSFATDFGASPTSNDDLPFVPGQALTALLEAYQYSHACRHSGTLRLDNRTHRRVLESATRALGYYSSFFQTHKLDLGANYPIWQVQAFARLVLLEETATNHLDCTSLPLEYQEASDYVLDLCSAITASPAWRMIRRGPSFFANLNALEIVCGLEALALGVLVAQKSCSTTKHKDENNVVLDTLKQYAAYAVDFVQWSQQRLPPSSPYFGGLGYGGLVVTEQRVDVTGHALSALLMLQKATGVQR